MQKRFFSDKSGASALEFAIVAPVFLLFLFGIFYTAWATYNVTAAKFAIDDTARALQLNQKLTAAELDQIFKSKITTGIMTVQTLELNIEVTQSGFSLAKLRVPISIILKIPFMDELRIDLSASSQTALIST